jgi:hypothetical protein
VEVRKRIHYPGSLIPSVAEHVAVHSREFQYEAQASG